ncbi:MAG: YfbU family protein [Lentisphaerae bacterium]|nr:YfbU family protein [Lentisphaerota bacterium]MCP4100863.1 YfbU family protein [Lentisphaerota bacterium]
MSQETISRNQRLILSNQYNLLSRLQPEKQDHYQRMAKIVSYGYVECYDELFSNINEKEFSKETSSFVYNVLSMYRALNFSNQQNCYDDRIEEVKLELPGFDAETEEDKLTYAVFLIIENKQFEELNPAYNPLPMTAKIYVAKVQKDAANLAEATIIFTL